MRVELENAVILHRRAWRDTSLIIEAFTRDYGRIGVVAKGARRARSRWRGLLEPLALASLSWSGRGQLHTLTGVELLRSHALAGNALMGGLYAAELVMRLTARADPHPLLHDSLAALLSTLNSGAPAVIALRFFERDLLDETGYGLNLARTPAGEPVAVERDYAYHPESGLRPAAAAAAGRHEILVSGRTLRGLANGRLPDREAVRQARALMRAALAPHLGARPLKSVQTLHAMRQLAGGRGQTRTGDTQ